MRLLCSSSSGSCGMVAMYKTLPPACLANCSANMDLPERTPPVIKVRFFTFCPNAVVVFHLRLQRREPQVLAFRIQLSWSMEIYQNFMVGYVRRINEATLNVTIGGVRIGNAKYSRLAQINLRSRIITFS